MKKALETIAAADLVFMLFLAVSSFFDGAISSIIYALGFALPLVGALVINKNTLSKTRYIKLARAELPLFIPIIPIAIAAVILLSYLTSLLLGAFGINDDLVLEGNFISALLRYALFASLFEELLFRYLPIRLLSEHSPRCAVFISAALFALVHLDIFQIPYAFAAGLIFAAVDMICESVIPSIVIHILNNTLAVCVYFYGTSEAFSIAYPIVVFTLAIAAAVTAFIMREKYKERIKLVFARK